MKPSEVRQRILDEHVQIRAMLDGIEDLAVAFEGGNAGVAADLLERGRALYEALIAHLDHEDAQLAPALRESGDEGRRCAANLAHEHREQRELLHYLLGRLSDQKRPTLLVARELKNFTGYVRGDMEHEEQTMLGEAILRD